jgi:hypothetical protein
MAVRLPRGPVIEVDQRNEGQDRSKNADDDKRVHGLFLRVLGSQKFRF